MPWFQRKAYKGGTLNNYMKDKRAFFFVVKMKMLPVLRVMLEKYGQDPCPWYPILSSHAGGAALQGKCLVRRVLMKLNHLPFHLISNYSLAGLRPLLFGIVIFTGRERIHLLPGKRSGPTEQKCCQISFTSPRCFLLRWGVTECHRVPQVPTPNADSGSTRHQAVHHLISTFW